MFRILLSLILFCGFGSISIGQTVAHTIKLYGEVFDDIGKPVVHAHIVNISSQIGTLTNRDGRFAINVFPEDTVKISSVGYKPNLLLIPFLNEKELHKTITLTFDTVALSETIIYPYPATLEALKEEFLALELEEEIPEFDLHLEKAGISPSPQTGMIISGPITALYNAFSRHAKIAQKYQGLVYQEQLRIKSKEIYNTSLVKRVTGLDTDEKAKKFMEYCDLEPIFILNSNEYELVCAIYDCYVRYSNTSK